MSHNRSDLRKGTNQSFSECKSLKTSEFRNPLAIFLRFKKKTIRNISKNQGRKSYLPDIHSSPLNQDNQKKKKFHSRKSINQKNLVLLHKYQISLNKNSTPADFCINALFNRPKQRSEQDVDFIKNYLLSMKSFMNIISKENNSNKDILIEQIARNLKHEKISKNNIICQFGDKGNKFYIILIGKIKILLEMKKLINLR